MIVAHGGALGLAIEIAIILLGLAALGAAFFVGARRKVDEYDPTRPPAEDDEPEPAGRPLG